MIPPCSRIHPFLLPSLILISILSGIDSVCAVEGPRNLRVWPSPVIISAEYPASLVVQEVLQDGTTVDRSRDPTLIIECQDQTLIEGTEVDGSLSVNKLQSDLRVLRGLRVGKSILNIRCAGLNAQCEVEVISTDSEGISFPREISAVLGKSGCNLGTCHGNLHGKGGFRLSLRGDDPALDFTSITRDRAGRRIDWFHPSNSLLLQKPTGDVSHQGGVRFREDQREYAWLLKWIQQGAPWRITNEESATDSTESLNEEVLAQEQVVALQIEPRQARLRPASRQQQLIVRAKFGDGTVRDVTHLARYESNVVSGVSISEDGLVSVDQPVDIAIAVSYLGGRGASRLTFLPHDESPTWHESAPTSPLDTLVEAKLRDMQLVPESMANDAVFLRRIYLVTVGRLPSPEEARAFLLDEDIEKRSRLTRQLLSDPGYGLLWALHWSDLLRNEQKVMSSVGATQWYRWLYDQISNDRPLDAFVSELVTTVGSTYEHPAASFHRTHRDPATAAESVAQVFLGVRLQCAKCHNHPFDVWRQDDYYGLAAYFTTVERKQLENAPKDKFDKHIITGDEIVSLAEKKPSIRHPGRVMDVPPKPMLDTALSARPANSISGPADANPLKALSDWLTQDNRMFARNLANRIWFHVMGRGIVDPPDDFRDSNPPSNPELLEYLTDELIQSGYSTRHVTSLILNSRTFARNAARDLPPEDSLASSSVFAGYPMRRMPAEVLLDTMCDVTGVPWDFNLKEEVAPTIASRVIAMPGIPSKANLLTAFGKPNRLLACECERSTDVSLGQSLLLVNGQELRERLSKANNRIGRILQEKQSMRDAIEELYLAVLTRLPEVTERDSMEAYISGAQDQRAAYEDVMWALINSKEFILIR